MVDQALFTREALLNAKHRYDGHEADRPAPISLREQLEVLTDEVRFWSGVLDQKATAGKIHFGFAESHKAKLRAVLASFRVFVEAVEEPGA